MIILTADDLLEMQDSIGYECKVGVLPDPAGLIIRAWFTDASGENHYWQSVFSFDQMERFNQRRLTEHFCSVAKAFFARVSWEKRYVGVPRSMP